MAELPNWVGGHDQQQFSMISYVHMYGVLYVSLGVGVDQGPPHMYSVCQHLLLYKYSVLLTDRTPYSEPV